MMLENILNSVLILRVRGLRSIPNSMALQVPVPSFHHQPILQIQGGWDVSQRMNEESISLPVAYRYVSDGSIEIFGIMLHQ